MPQRSEFRPIFTLTERERIASDKCSERVAIRLTGLHEAGRKVMQDSESGWYCLHVKGGCEFDVEKYLCDHDVEAFLASTPAYEIKERGRVKVVKAKAICGPYLPVRCASSPKAFTALLDVPDVMDIIGGQRPHKMSDREIKRFKGMFHDGSLAKLVVDTAIKAGDEVFVKAGIFADMQGLLSEIKGSSAVVSIGFGKVSMPLAFLEKL